MDWYIYVYVVIVPVLLILLSSSCVSVLLVCDVPPYSPTFTRDVCSLSAFEVHYLLHTCKEINIITVSSLHWSSVPFTHLLLLPVLAGNNLEMVELPTISRSLYVTYMQCRSLLQEYHLCLFVCYFLLSL